MATKFTKFLVDAREEVQSSPQLEAIKRSDSGSIVVERKSVPRLSFGDAAQNSMFGFSLDEEQEIPRMSVEQLRLEAVKRTESGSFVVMDGVQVELSQHVA